MGVKFLFLKDSSEGANESRIGRVASWIDFVLIVRVA